MMTRKELTDMLTKRLTDKYEIGQAILFASESTCGETIIGEIINIAHPYITVYVDDIKKEFQVLDFEVRKLIDSV